MSLAVETTELAALGFPCATWANIFGIRDGLLQEPLSPQISRLLDNIWLHLATDGASP
jgi:hypothetical protein